MWPALNTSCALIVLLIAACTAKPRRPPEPRLETRSLLPAEQPPPGTAVVALATSESIEGHVLTMTVRQGALERRVTLDRRPSVSCGPELASAGDLAACVADEVVYRLVRVGGSLEVRWARAAGGPVATLTQIEIGEARVVHSPM